MVEYINERYKDDAFVFRIRKNDYGGGVSRGTPGCFVDSEKYPGADILVRYSGSETYYDNYLYIKYKKQEDEYLKNILDEVFDYEYKLYIYESESSHLIRMDRISADASFDDYMKNYYKFLRMEVVVAPDYIINDKDDLVEILGAAFSSGDITVNKAMIYFSTNREDYDSLPEGIIRSPGAYYRSKSHEEYIYINRTKDGEQECSWEESR